MTGVYTKKATERIIDGVCAASCRAATAFLSSILIILSRPMICTAIFSAIIVSGEFVERLKKFCREDDIIGRIGGDEFVVFGTISDEEAPAAKRPACARSLTLSVRTAAAAGKCLSA